MSIGDEVRRVERLSDDELLAGLSGALGSSRRWTASVLAHLAEVEDRRLHLLAGHGSLFAYCTTRLGMSEDEACRRIDVARLARRFPILYEKLASGAVSLSVAALLKHHLDQPNHVALLGAVSGKTVARAREVLAAWFPRPDAPASIRKLPERRAATDAPSDASVITQQAATAPLELPRAIMRVGADAGERSNATAIESATARPVMLQCAPASSSREATLASMELATTARSIAAHLRTPAPASAASSVDPLSPGRYKIVFTADAELKRKLELARDLLRHAIPSGDVATIVGRALDLLVEETLRRKFARTARPKGAASAKPPSTRATPTTSAAPERQGAVARGSRATACLEPADAGASPSASDTAALAVPSPSVSRHVPSAVRRAVLERDGLRCTWQSPDGVRCESRAWLEHDHIHPRGQGGTNTPSNIHIYCRAHNQLAAEQTYGRATLARIRARRSTSRAPRSDSSGEVAALSPANGRAGEREGAES